MSRYGLQTEIDRALGEWLRLNPGKTLAMASPAGTWVYKPKFKKNTKKLAGLQSTGVIIDDMEIML